MRSLRFRLPLLFLLGILVAGLVTALFAVRLFQDYSRDRTLDELRRQAAGLAQLYAQQAVTSVDEERRAPRFAAPLLERATDSRLFYAGVELFPGQLSGLRRVSRDALDWPAVQRGEVQTLEFVPPGSDRVYLAAAQPITLGGETFGALVVAKPRAELRERWLVLLGRVGLAFLAGLAVAAGLVWYLSRRVTQPVLALSRATDQVAEGKYDAALPEPRFGDEIGHLTERFREMTERLALAQKRERNFLMTVSHELRTPITAIRGHVDALREGLAEDPEATNASLEVISAETSRLARLVQDLLDLARLQTHQFRLEQEEVELRRVVEQAYQSFSEEARRRGIEYERSLVADPVITTDGDRVLQVVSNLLQNAFAWTPDGGRISVSLAAQNGVISVAVDDTGPGILPEEREMIFRPFWSRDGSGTGLGLPIACELAHALGGDVALETEVGRGSRFELRLPAPQTPQGRDWRARRRASR
jgi:signal transduction histidine kinase